MPEVTASAPAAPAAAAASSVAASTGLSTTAPADSLMVTSQSEETKVERPQESATGIKRPSWMAADGSELKVETEKKTETTDAEKQGKPATESNTATSGPEAGKPAAAPVEGEGTAEDSTATPKEHPKGYVPVAAVQEARAETKLLRGELRDAQAKLVDLEKKTQAKPPAPVKPDEFKDFKVLTDDDLELLADDDPRAAANYAKKLIKYERHVEQQSKDKEQQDKAEHTNKVQRQVAIDRIRETLPSKETVDELSAFAVDLGFPAEAFFLTDPATMVIMPGQSDPVPLNTFAADVVALLANAKQKAGGKDISSLTIDDIPEGLKTAIIAEAQEKILGKVKEKGRTRTVSSLPASSRDDGNRFAGKSYKDLSPEERKEYMSGTH